MAAIIKIKRSSGTAAPSQLQLGELAVTTSTGTDSDGGGRLYLGASVSGNDIRTIGGQYYVDVIERATSTNTNNEIVKRDASGNFIANIITAALSGNASTATKLQTPRNISLTGDVTGTISFDGSANVNINTTLTDVLGTPGTYGSTALIPSITVNSKGQITSVSNNSISTDFAIEVDDNTNFSVDGGDTLKIKGGTGITTEQKDGDTVEIDIDSSVVTDIGSQVLTNKTINASNNTLQNIANSSLQNSSISITGDNAVTQPVALGTNFSVVGTNQEITTSVAGNSIQIGLPDDVTINGDLTVAGTMTTVDTEVLSVSDPLIELAKGNDTDAVDIGFYGSYDDGAVKYTGFFRDQTNSEYYLLDNLSTQPDSTFTGTGVGGVIQEEDLATLNVVLDGGTFT